MESLSGLRYACRRSRAQLCLPFVLTAVLSLLAEVGWSGPRTASIEIREHHIALHLYGDPKGDPIVLSSGDGGWVRLAPHVAEILAADGFFVVGFDSKAYLSSFTDGEKTLSEEDVPRDFAVLIDYASKSSETLPILIGISEGAGLSVLAATTKENQERTAGVIGLGLPDVNELGWRFRDVIIYLTKGVPNEPSFSVAKIIERVSPLPLAAIHATHDEYVPLDEVENLMKLAHEPKRLWVIDAPNHRFGGREGELENRLREAIEWVRTERRKRPSSAS